MRVCIFIFLSIFLVGCSYKSSIDGYKIIDKFDENLSYKINKDWYKLYKQINLNLLVDKALKNNKDIAVANLNTMQAYARAGIVSSDKLVTFNTNYQTQTQRRINTHNSSWTKSYGLNILASYEVDLFSKIKDDISASEWVIKASEFDKSSLELSVMNLVINSYFKELYLNDVLKLLNSSYENYNNLYKIVKVKFKEGKIDKENLYEVEKTIFSIENRILNYKKDRLANKEILKNLIFLKDEKELDLLELSLKDIEFIGIDFDIFYEALSSRPDLNALISKINSSFYNYKFSKKAFYPSITIGSSLSSNSNEFDSSSFELSNLSANLRINLPFLNYKKLKNQLKISELEFEKNVINYEKKLIEITNELDRLNREYILSKIKFENSKNTLSNDKKLLEVYYQRYINGKYELKEYLDAKNRVINSQINQLEQKYLVLINEVAIYKNLGGKIYKK